MTSHASSPTSVPTVFHFQDLQVRTVTDELGDPWFVATDVCDILEHTNSRMAIEALDDDELMSQKLTSGGQLREMNLISESGLYTLIIRSNKPQAKKFRKWVTAEVLPAIRKTGSYSTPLTGSLAILESKQIAEVTYRTAQVAKMAKAMLYRGDRARLIIRDAVLASTGVDVLEVLGVKDEVEAVANRGHLATYDLAATVNEFIAVSCQVSDALTCRASDFYRAFHAWFLDRHHGAAAPSLKAVGAIIHDTFQSKKSHGTIVYLGLTLKSQEVQS